MRWLPISGMAGAVGLTFSLALAQASQEPVWHMAALVLGEKADLAAAPNEIEPRPHLKRQVEAFPIVDATRKGDPFIGLRPSLEGRLTIQ